MHKGVIASVVRVVVAAVCAFSLAACGSTVATSTGPSPAKCSVTLAAPAGSLASSGATATVAITTQPECTWSASAEASWISGLTPASGQGSRQLEMQVAPNPDVVTRQADVIVNGERAHITQDAAPCRFELSSTQQTIPTSGGTGRITVSAAAGCAWTAQADASWVVITAGTTGTGAGSVSFTVAANPGSTRTASLVVADQTVKVVQGATPSPPPVNCTYSVNPSTVSASSIGVTGSSVTVSVSTGCTWTAASNVGWLSITSGASGSGNGTVMFSIAANTGGERTGALTIGDQTVTVTQAAAPSCASVNQSTVSVPSTESTGLSVSVTAPAGCAWTAVSNAAWISITSGASGTGNGSVRFTVSANSGAARTGTLTVANHTVTVNQAAAPCSYSVTPTSLSIGAAGGTGTPISVSTSSSSCSWTATSNASWVSILTGASGTGNGSVTYSVQPNTGGARNGTLTVAGQTVTISQSAPCTYSISPMSQTIDRNGGTEGPVAVATQSGCAWTTVSNVNWITVTSGSSGTGNGNVTFTVAANTTGSDRTGTLTIAGRTFTETQKK